MKSMPLAIRFVNCYDMMTSAFLSVFQFTKNTSINLKLFILLQIIDEKSLIKKYQREISALKLELDQFRRGMLVGGVNPEEIMTLKQKVLFHFLFFFIRY